MAVRGERGQHRGGYHRLAPGPAAGARWTRNPDPRGSAFRLYRNGVSLACDPLDPADFADYGDAQLSLGARLKGDHVTQAFQGVLEEVRIWRTARTQEQVLDNLFTRLRGEKEDLIAYWSRSATTSAAGSSTRTTRRRASTASTATTSRARLTPSSAASSASSSGCAATTRRSPPIRTHPTRPPNGPAASWAAPSAATPLRAGGATGPVVPPGTASPGATWSTPTSGRPTAGSSPRRRRPRTR
ncbi:LamG-like jellyroll fold domain-containing protein [Streptomyces gilvosporeus]|uniref:LamG-like jellyroll fold domain-containing protein n=1 Tax=Streptomyces gilvosporeus TaxID=553510 RepID=UPI0033C587AB